MRDELNLSRPGQFATARGRERVQHHAPIIHEIERTKQPISGIRSRSYTLEEFQVLLKTSYPAPPFDERLPGRSIPILFEVGVASRSEANAVVVAKPTFERLLAGPKQFAKIVLKESTPFRRIIIRGKRPFAAFKCGGQHSECSIGRYFQHHAAAVAGVDSGSSLFHGPPSGAHTVANTYFA